MKPYIFRSILALIIATSVLFYGQACTQKYTFSSLNFSQKNSGNGTVYDGKLVFLELENNFTCENIVSPKSIIRYEKKIWTRVSNTAEKCNYKTDVLTDVSYTSGASFLNYQGIAYLRDLSVTGKAQVRQFIVDPLASTTAPDASTTDGVCAASDGKCSLQAAFDEMNSIDLPTIISIPSGTYNLTANVEILINSPVLLEGASDLTSVLGGGLSTGILTTTSNAGALGRIIKNLKFVNGNTSSSVGASAINIWAGSMIISGCSFENNQKTAVIAGVFSGEVTVEYSKFSKSIVALDSQGASSFKVFRSEFFNNTIGLNMTDTADVSIEKSSFYNNISALQSNNCTSKCLIENSTFANNFVALYINVFPGYPDFIIRNTTVQGGMLSALTLRFDNGGGTGKVHLQNSILSNSISGQPNCSFQGSATAADIISQSSIVHDASCGTVGINIADPLLQSLSKGPTDFTPAMKPMSTSPAIDTGDNLFCAATDQQSKVRPHDFLGGGARCDIGAIELY